MKAPWSPVKWLSKQGNRIWSLRLLKAGSTSWGSGAINSDRGCRNAEEPASVRSFARRKGSSVVNHLPDFSYAIALPETLDQVERAIQFILGNVVLAVELNRKSLIEGPDQRPCQIVLSFVKRFFGHILASIGCRRMTA